METVKCKGAQREPRRARGVLLGGLAIAALAAGLMLSGDATALGPGGFGSGKPPHLPPVGGEDPTPPPPPPPPTAQDCMDDFLSNSNTCHEEWCSAFWLIIWWPNCNGDQLDNCMEKADQTYACCMGTADPDDCPPRS